MNPPGPVDTDSAPAPSPAAAKGRSPRVLVLSRVYPNSQFPSLGIWVERLVEAASAAVDPVVVSPVPYAPPLPFTDAFEQYRRVERRRTGDGGVAVEYPRFPAGPGNLLRSVDAFLQYLPVRRAADRFHRQRRLDLIHAHFIYPEGVMAARLGRRYGIPVITTEHSLWQPWLDDQPMVHRQVLAALDDISLVTVVSETVRRTVREVVGEREIETRLLPNVLDDQVFTPPDDPDTRVAGRLLFVGAVREVKGLDVAVRALDRLKERRPDAHLRVVGEPFRRSYRDDEREVRKLIERLGLSQRVTFVGGRPPEGVADEMRAARVLVVPSRRESFSSVTIEALACGTPVVATRCGGPEEILDDETGVLVDPNDPVALAQGMEQTLSSSETFHQEKLRRCAVNRYGLEVSRQRLRNLYADVRGNR